MRRLLYSCLMTFLVMTASAVPAKRGLWRTITLADGRQVSAELRGDEFGHYWRTADGQCYSQNEQGLYTSADMETLQRQVRQARQQRRMPNRQPRKTEIGGAHEPYVGSKKGIIILVEFTNKKFATGHTREVFDQIANEENYKEGQFRGSVHDYFSAQSDGQFDLTFDVVGPVQMDTTYQYYGKNSRWGGDAHAGTMVAKACEAVDSLVDFKDYDWDGDGEVDQVYVLYAGMGEASGGDENTIWPHEYNLQYSDYGHRLRLDNVYIDTYACGNELNYFQQLDGLGTICHEFSHCLGLPDMYDTEGNNFGLSQWSLMDQGCYNGNGYVPCGYTSYERMYAGWKEPIEITEPSVSVEGMQALSNGGDFYMIRNSGTDDEYLLLENRQRTGWDSSLPGNGLLVLHVDFSIYIWMMNSVNTTGYMNNHQRCTIYHADNSDNNLSGDPYPYNGQNYLSSTSSPALAWYNPDASGSRKPNFEIYNIKKSTGGLISFEFSEKVNQPDVFELGDEGTMLFHETFDRCNGTGGNDNRWSGTAGSGILQTDFYDYQETDFHGAYMCAKGGSLAKPGVLSTPKMRLNGDFELVASAAPWNKESTCRLVVSVLKEDGTELQRDTLQALTPNTWNECRLPLVYTNDPVRLQITATRNQFFLDDLLVQLYEETNGIKELTADSRRRDSLRIYSIGGRYMGTDASALPGGVYIRNGRKLVVHP